MRQAPQRGCRHTGGPSGRAIGRWCGGATGRREPGQLKQKIKGFLLATGVEEPPSSEKWLPVPILRRCLWRPGTAWRRREYLFLQEEHRALRREIRKATASAPGPLRTIDAGGRGRRSRCDRSSRRSASIVPRRGDGPARARLRPVGQKRLRSILIEGAWQWTWRDPEARELYNRHSPDPELPRRRSRRGTKTGDQAVSPSTASMEGAAARPRSV